MKRRFLEVGITSLISAILADNIRKCPQYVCVYSHVGGNNSMYKDMYAQYLKLPFLVQICRQLKDAPSAILGSAPASSNISATLTLCLLQASCRGVAPSSPYIQYIRTYTVYTILLLYDVHVYEVFENIQKRKNDIGMAHS